MSGWHSDAPGGGAGGPSGGGGGDPWATHAPSRPSAAPAPSSLPPGMAPGAGAFGAPFGGSGGLFFQATTSRRGFGRGGDDDDNDATFRSQQQQPPPQQQPSQQQFAPGFTPSPFSSSPFAPGMGSFSPFGPSSPFGPPQPQPTASAAPGSRPTGTGPAPIGTRAGAGVPPPGFKPPPGFGGAGMQQQLGSMPPGLAQGWSGFPAPAGAPPPGMAPSPPQQQQQQAQGGSGPPGFPPPTFAPNMPGGGPRLGAPLAHDSHVQCSLCRVIVPNTPASLHAHDTSPGHIMNERRQREMRMQQQAQSGASHPPGMPSPSPFPSISSSPLSLPLAPSSSSTAPAAVASSSSSVSSSSQAPLSLDLASLQSQLRNFMLSSQSAREAGQQPQPMEPALMAQLAQVQAALQQNAQQTGTGARAPGAAAEEQKNGGGGKNGAAALPPGAVASTAGPFPSRAALIAASSEVHFLSPRRPAKRVPNYTVPVNLDFDLRVLLRDLQPEERTFQVREEIRRLCESVVQQAWGADRCSVQLFGSSVNTLCEPHSDVDLCLLLDERDALQVDKPALVEKLALLLAPHFRDILALPKARVPIVKFSAPQYGLACDLGINNRLACRNSALIRDYMRCDSRARDLCLLIKYWARRRKINDPYRGTLSSYCYVLMVIAYLQNAAHCHPPVLPCLQHLGRDQASREQIDAANIDGFDCWYFDDIERVKKFGESNKQSLAELLVGFFRVYSHEYDYKEAVVSCRVGAYLEKKKKVWAESGKKDRQLLCVEDMFDVTHNLSRGCDGTALYEIRGEFQRAFRMLVQEGATFADVCAPYTKEWRGA